MKKFEFKPMQWVLVKYAENEEWTLAQFSHMSSAGNYVMCGGICFSFCIPYKGNKHLRGTTDTYVETKSKSEYVPKDGDFVTFVAYVSGIKFTAICNRYMNFVMYYYAGTVGRERNNVHLNNAYNLDSRDVLRPATEDEKNELLSKLHEQGKDWDAETKEVVDWKWTPSMDDTYYFPNLDNTLFKFKTIWSVWYGDVVDLERKKRNFVFRTEEECKAMCDKLNEAIKKVK